MATQGRRSGCGCLVPLFLIVFLAPVVFGATSGIIESVLGPTDLDIVDFVVGAAVLAAVLGVVAVFRRRRQDDEDVVADHGRPTSTRPADPAPRPAPPPTPPSTPPGRLPRGLRTEPEDEDTRRLKERLAEAVSDLSETVEGMPEAGTGRAPTSRTSAEMIADAKRRIRDWDRDPPSP